MVPKPGVKEFFIDPSTELRAIVRTEKKKLPLPLKRVRKAIPPPGQPFRQRKKYNRKKVKEEIKHDSSEFSLSSSQSSR